MKKLHAILLVIGVALLIWLVRSVGLSELWRELTILGWGLVPLVLGEGLAEMIHTVGWRHCLSGPLRRLPWATLFRIRMSGYAINYLTPTAALGGEVTKGVLLAAYHRGPEAASGVLIGKLCFALAHVIFVSLGALLVLWRLPLAQPLWVAMMVCGGLLACGMIAFLFLQKYGHLGALVRWVAAGKPANSALDRFARSVTSVDTTMMRFYRERPMDLTLAMAWHLAGYSIGIAQTFLFFRLLGYHATWSVAAATWFLGMWFDLLTFAVPLNLGTLEGTRMVVLRALGYSAVTGLTYGLAIRLAQMFWSCLGLIGYAVFFPQASGAVVAKSPNVTDSTPDHSMPRKPVGTSGAPAADPVVSHAAHLQAPVHITAPRRPTHSRLPVASGP
jgi:hypothetical protein